MSFKASEVKESKTSQFINFGVQELKVNDITFQDSSAKTSRKMIYHVEGRPITDNSFVGSEGAVGQVGKIATSFLIPESDQEKEEFGKLVTIARKVGVDTDKLPDYNTLEEAVTGILPLIRGKFGARFLVIANAYWGTDKAGKTVEKYSLAFARFKFVENVTEVPNTEMVFDKTNQYHYNRKALADKKPTSSGDAPTGGLNEGSKDLPW